MVASSLALPLHPTEWEVGRSYKVIYTLAFPSLHRGGVKGVIRRRTHSCFAFLLD